MHEIKWNKDVAYGFRLFKMLNWPIGTWPLQEYNMFANIRSSITISILVFTQVVLFVEMFQGNTSTYDNLDILMILGCAAVGVVKILSFRFYAENLVQSVRAAFQDYDSIDSDWKRTIVRKHALIGRTLSQTMIFCSFWASVLVSAAPILAGEMKKLNSTNKGDSLTFPYPSNCIMSHINITPEIYIIVCLVQLFISVLGCVANYGTDSLFLGITLHMCGQVEILKTEYTSYLTTSVQRREQLTELLSRHRQLLTLAKILVGTINLALLVQISVSCVLICLIGFQFILSLQINNRDMLYKATMVLFSLFSQLFAYCYVGDYFTSQMREVGFSIYSAAWYELPVDLTKNLIFAIARTQRPVNVVAGFVPINLETYMSILKTSLSYLSVLRVMLST